nr:hypothetical protein [Tanacetum cinerariifolium]
MENTMLELVEVCRQKELYCMHDNVDDLIESALNSKLLSINLGSQRLDKKKQEVKNVVERPTECETRIVESLQNFRVVHKKSSISLKNTSQISPVHAIKPFLLTEEPEYLLSMGYEHLNTTPKMKSDEIIKSGAEKLVPIPSEYEVTAEDKRECDVLVCEDSSTIDVCKDHSEILSESNNDDISSDDDALGTSNEEFDLEDIFQIQDVVLHEKLLSINRLIAIIESLNDNPTPDHERLTSIVKKDNYDNSTNDPLLEEVDLFLASHNLIPQGIENFDYDSEGDIHFLEELLSDDSIPLPKNKSSDSDHQDDPSFPRPPPEPPDVEVIFDLESDLISTMKNNIDELNGDKCFDLGSEIDVLANVEDDDYFPFIFVIRNFLPYLIYLEVFSLLLSAESEDTIFNPGISV